MNKFLRSIFFLLIVKPISFFLLGLNIRNREKLPKSGPAIIIANHNSHLDTLILMSLFSQRTLQYVHPVAAADYFLRSPALAWFATKIIGIIPIERHRADKNQDPLLPISKALQENSIVIFFPEGTRGEPEQLAKFKSGIAHLSERHPEIKIIPVFTYGIGKALPKGEALLVPRVIDLYIGDSLYWQGNKENFMQNLENTFIGLREKVQIPHEN